MALAYLAVAVILLMPFFWPSPARPYEITNPLTPHVAEGLWFDDARWSALYMPDSTVACRWRGIDLRCVPVPPGSILLIPQEAGK